MTYADGREYIGDFTTNFRSGTGLLTWPNGRRYVGSWKKDKMSGEGFYTDKNRLKRRGLWINGKRIRWIEDDGDCQTEYVL